MVKIVIKETTFNINRIVAFGCSFTAGTEILDHLLNSHFVDLKKKLSAVEWWEQLKTDSDQMALQLELRKKESNHAWPAHLASYLGVDFVNYAQVGNSNENIYWQIQQQIEAGLITEHDLILIGITGAQRSMFFSKNNTDPIPFLLSNIDSYADVLTENILKWFSDDRIVWNYYRDLKSFESVKNQLNGRAFIVPTEQIVKNICPWPYSNGYGVYCASSEKNALFFNKIINQLYDSDLFTSIKHSLYSFATNSTKLPHGHLNEDAHKSFAELLSKIYITKVNF
jgi:hypothetical protein